MSDVTEILMAVKNADAALMKALVAEHNVYQTRPNQAGDATRKIRQAIEVALGAHRRGGCTSDELATLERVAAEIGELCR